MALQDQRHNKSHPTRQLSFAYGDASHGEKKADAALDRILEKIPYAKQTEDGVVVPLNKYHMLNAGAVVNLAERTPGLKERIFFNDKDVIRPYGDVVVDLEKDGLSFARTLHMTEEERKFIFITPPVVGFTAGAPLTVLCRPQMFEGRKGPVSVHAQVTLDANFWTDAQKKDGTRYVLQSERTTLSPRCEDWSAIEIDIRLCAAMSVPFKAHPLKVTKDRLARAQSGTGTRYGFGA